MQAFFLPAAPGRRFCLWHPARGALRGKLLYVHPFAEEMNKSRRMAALQSRALADAGFAVLQLDLHGCGDSSGDFGDVSWRGWCDDVLAGLHWLRQQPPQAPLWLWGLRAGSLLAAQAAAQWADACNLLLWQPARAGKPLVQQFLRLKAASEIGAEGGGAGKAVARLREQLGRGESIEVAGYRLRPALVAGFEQALLTPPLSSRAGSRLLWLELASEPQEPLNPGSVAALDAWRAAGFAVESQRLPGPAFWQTSEIEEAPALLAATLAALMHAPAARSDTLP